MQYCNPVPLLLGNGWQSLTFRIFWTCPCGGVPLWLQLRGNKKVLAYTQKDTVCLTLLIPHRDAKTPHGWKDSWQSCKGTVFPSLKFAQNLCTCVAQPDCTKTKWKSSRQVIIKGPQNHWTNHSYAFHHNTINFLSQTLPLIELAGILAWTSVWQRQYFYLLYVHGSRIQDGQNQGVHIFWG